MKKIEHRHCSLLDLEKSNELFKNLLGKSTYSKLKSSRRRVRNFPFFQVGETKVDHYFKRQNVPDSPIAKYIDRKSEGFIYRICGGGYIG